jgi:Fibronectin type III domain
MPEQPDTQRSSAPRRAIRVLRAVRADRTAGMVAVALLVAGGGAVAWRGGAGAVAPRMHEVGAWLSSTKQGSVVHANGVSGRPDARVKLRDAAGHPLTVTQDDDAVLVTDTVTGDVSRIDPAQLAVTQTVNTDHATQVVTGHGLTYFIDSDRGTVQRVNLTNLSAVGDPIALNQKLGQGGIDDDGTLWVAVPDSGALVPIADGKAGTPVSVGQHGDALSLTMAKGVPVATDATRNTMTVVSRSGGLVTVNLPSPASPAGPPPSMLAPAATDGPVVPVVAAKTGELVLVDTATATPSSVTFSGVAGHDLGAPATLGHRIYVPDNSTGRLLVYDSAADKLLNQITVTDKPTKLDMFVKDGMLWVNDADGPDAIAVDTSGTVHHIGKYEQALAGGPPVQQPPAQQPPAQQPPAQQPPVQRPPKNKPTRIAAPPPPQPAPQKPPPQQPPPPPKPVPSTSSPPPAQAPGSVKQTPQPGSILVTFTPVSASNVTGYTLSGAPSGARVAPSQVPPSGAPFKFTVSNLNCGSKYRFGVTVHYSSGSATAWASSRVRPCVPPSDPRNLRLDAGTQHQIGVDWDPPASDGGDTVHYDVSGGGQTHRGLTKTSDTLTGLANFQDYTVTVTAKNQAGSRQPPASKSVALRAGPWSGTTWNPLYTLSIRARPDKSSAVVYTFPVNSSVTVPANCIVPGGAWVDPTGTPSGSMWFKVSSPATGYIAAGYVKVSGVWDGPC